MKEIRPPAWIRLARRYPGERVTLQSIVSRRFVEDESVRRAIVARDRSLVRQQYRRIYGTDPARVAVFFASAEPTYANGVTLVLVAVP